MRKTNDDYLNNLKTELEKGNNLIDYFITIGINEEIIFNNFLYENDVATLNASELIKPEILTKFPPLEKKNVIVDENIIRVIMFIFISLHFVILTIIYSFLLKRLNELNLQKRFNEKFPSNFGFLKKFKKKKKNFLIFFY